MDQDQSHETTTALDAPRGSNDNATHIVRADTTHMLAQAEVVQYLRSALWHCGVGSEDMRDAIADVQTEAVAVARRGRMPATPDEWKALAATIAEHRTIDAQRRAAVRDKYDAGSCDDPDAYLSPTLHWEQRDPVDTKRYLGVLKDLFDSGRMPEHGAEILWDEADGTPHAEIGADLGIRAAVVDKRLARMRAKFRARLALLGMLVLTLLLTVFVGLPCVAVILLPDPVAAPAPGPTPSESATPNDCDAGPIDEADATAPTSCSKSSADRGREMGGVRLSK